MSKRLFFTGEIGCGKSTAIQAALGPCLEKCDGFLTKRNHQPHLHFTLESPDGSKKDTFLDFSTGKPVLNLEVFANLGVPLLAGERLVLDEIGGIELLCPEFAAALDTVLKSDIPILGVIKGRGAADALIKALDLSESYELAAARLRNTLESTPDILVYECKKYDEQALLLAEQWAEEYLHG